MFTAAQVMAAVMLTVSPALRICARLKVGHSNFLFLFFRHLAFLTVFGLCQLRRIFCCLGELTLKL